MNAEVVHLIKFCTMNACGGVEVLVHTFLSLGGGDWPSSSPCHLTPQEIAPILLLLGYAVARLVEVLYYKLEGHRFNSQWV